MPTDQRAKLAAITRFDQLIAYLRDEMGWPIARDSFEEVDDLFYDFTSDELGIDLKNAAKIEEIKRLRPLSAHQPWGVFFVKFEPKALPVLALRRILSQVAIKKRPSASSAERTAWAADDLLFVSNYGEGDKRQISFAHFSQSRDWPELPTLKVLGWDNLNTALRLDAVVRELTQHLAWPDDDTDLDAWRQQWRAAFTLRHREVITTSKELSIRLAELARAIRGRIRTALAIETSRGPITSLWKAFQEALVHDLDADGFADMYAQTIAYGLLSARIADPHKKTADDFAAHMRTNPFLRELMEVFLEVGGRRGRAGGPGLDFDELGVSDVVDLLDDAQMEAVVRDFGDRNPQEDPVIHFYEAFLAAYDKRQKVGRGVFYTPRPVVSYIVRSVDELLRTEFGLDDGLAATTTWGEMAQRHKNLEIPDGTSPDQAFVQILDPATGTGTFLVEVIDVIHKTVVAKWVAQGHGQSEVEALWNEYVPKHLLPRLHAYELLMAPYAIAHLKLGLKLHETGYRFDSEERARIYLTNALEPAGDAQLTLDFLPALAHEAQAVNVVKRSHRFTVVIGNPPYAGVSSNRGPWIERLIDDYRLVEGVPLGEKKVWLKDDYVKFLRMSESLIATAGTGILGLITNNTYFEGLTFRGMRSHLLRTFDHAEFLNLHGNSNLKETAADGSKDENVFDIMQGVGISILLRRPTKSDVSESLVGDLFGTREVKYSLLSKGRNGITVQATSTPPPHYFFKRSGGSTASEYADFASVAGLFDIGGLGFQSHRDHLVVAFSVHELNRRLDRLFDLSISDRDVSAELGITDYERFIVGIYRRRHPYDASLIRRIQYRPFDYRYVYYGDLIVQRRLFRVHGNMLAWNRGLNLVRQTKAPEWRHVMISDTPTPALFLEIKDGSYQYPALKYAGATDEILPSAECEPNIAPTMVEEWLRAFYDVIDAAAEEGETAKLAASAGLAYLYATMHSDVYRQRYGEELKIDFPRVPLSASRELKRSLVRMGQVLIDVHLLLSPTLNVVSTSYGGPASPEVGRVGWSDDTVWLDAAKTNGRDDHVALVPGSIGIAGVPEAVWRFRVGGYQVCQRWLKDRAGRTLTADEITHYQKVIEALTETIRLMKEIDEVIEQHGGWPDAFGR